MTEPTWEPVTVQREGGGIISEVVSETDRLIVPGGWLYRTQVYNAAPSSDAATVVVAMVFVRDDGRAS